MWTEWDYALRSGAALWREHGRWDFTDGWYNIHSFLFSLSLSPDGNVLFLVPVQTQLLYGRRFMGALRLKITALSPRTHWGVCGCVWRHISVLQLVCVCFHSTLRCMCTLTLKHTRNHTKTHTLQTNRGVWQIRVCASQPGGLNVCVLICNLLALSFSISAQLI